MPRRFDAVICDIDGCLGPENHDPLDAPSLATLAEYNIRAIRTGDHPVITLCSGRPQPYAEAISRLIGNSALPCIAEMGVWIYDPRDNSYHIDPAITQDHLAAVRAAQTWIERDLCPLGIIIQPCKTASISLWHPSTELLMTKKPVLEARFQAERWPFRVSSTVSWINCDLAHVNKDTGIARLMSMTGLTKDRMAGIGDTIGDLAIRRSVAWFGAPSNAAQQLHAYCDYVSPHKEVGGVLDILSRIVN